MTAIGKEHARGCRDGAVESGLDVLRFFHRGYRPSSPRGRTRIVRAAAASSTIAVMYSPM